jgi:hypothetical protein
MRLAPLWPERVFVSEENRRVYSFDEETHG